MRISTSTLYDQGVLAIQRQQADLLKTQQQVALGKKFLTPSDNPPAAVRALELTESIAVNEQFKSNAVNATDSLKQEDTVLTGVTNALDTVRTIAISAVGSLSASDKASLATELRLKYQELLALANEKDGNGEYLFGGFNTSTLPFSQTSGAAVYQGDQGQRKVQISPSRQIDVSDSGAALFKPGVSGQDVFQTIDNLANLLSGLATTPPGVTAQQALTETATEMNNVLVVHGSVGVRLKELENVQAANKMLGVHYQNALSDLQSLDYAAGIAELNQRQTNLQAALQSFKNTSGMSLFQYL